MVNYNKLIALKVNERNITYAQLNKISLKIASLILLEKITGANIGIFGQRNFSTYLGILATLYSGNTYVPINKNYPLVKIKEIFKDSKIEVLICSEKDWTKYNNILSSIELIKLIIIPEGSVYDVNNRIKTEENFKDIDCIDKPVSVKNSDNIYIMYTSGSTGKPKGVQVMHSNVYSLIKALDKIYRIKPGYNCSQTFDLSFDPSICDTFLTLYKGGTICVLNEEELICPSDYIIRENIHFWHSVPTLANNIKRLGFLNKDIFPNLKFSVFAGEPFAINLAKAWSKAAPNSRVENRYGPTELTVDVTRYIFSKKDNYGDFNNDILPIGKAFSNQKIKIIDQNNKLISKKFNNGELVVSGSQVTKGYLNDIKKTFNSFVNFDWDNQNDLWYRTGDLVFLNKNNNFEIIGRIDKQIKIGGKRVELGEVEYILMQKGNFEELVVVAKKDKLGTVKYLVGFVTKKISPKKINIIQKKCHDFMEEIFFPKRFIQVKKIPTMPSGKIDRSFFENYLNDFNNK